MKTHDTYILTLFRDPESQAELRGRIRHVVSGNESVFTSTDDLVRLLREFADRHGKNEESIEEVAQ